MPYINKKDREILTWFTDSTLILSLQLKPGILNYLITKLVRLFLGSQPNYEKFNAAIGVLECAKLELYRRMVAPYEDTKMRENGDVYR